MFFFLFLFSFAFAFSISVFILFLGFYFWCWFSGVFDVFIIYKKHFGSCCYALSLFSISRCLTDINSGIYFIN